MTQLSCSVIRTAREGVNELDKKRRAEGMSQKKISELANTPDVGQQYYRMYGSGDVRLSLFIRFLHALGYELMIVQKED